MRLEHEFRKEIRRAGGLSRRTFLAWTGALGTMASIGNESVAGPAPRFSHNPFSLGVASGDPDQQSVVLWTRLAPEPFQPSGGMPAQNVEVAWQIADDEAMKSIVASGTAVATPQLGHSVHVEPRGLRADRWYFYQFRVGDITSPIGRTRTLPAAGSSPGQVKFAVTSCQNYEQGLFTAYEQMVRDEPDLVFHLGDYIYEYAAGRTGKVRTHLGDEIQSLDDYRIRYAQYRSDPLLQAMHHGCPWMVTWDDHEFDNNCAGAVSEEKGVDPITFLVRRVNAYQAYYEMMPLRRRSLPRGSDMRLYRGASYGDLAELLILDTRQYRSDQPNDDRASALNDAALNPAQSMLGAQQRGWLYQRLITSQAKWNVLAQQVMMGLVNRGEVDPPKFSMDQWPGYAYERMQLMRFMRERRVANPVVLTGDIHSHWANELRVDDRRHDEPLVASEFVATSLASGGNGPESPPNLERLLAQNPCVKFHNVQRGYILCTVTADRWRSDYMVVNDVLQPGGHTTPRASFVVEAGDPALKPV
jgi:alkaline phosphatase D